MYSFGLKKRFLILYDKTNLKTHSYEEVELFNMVCMLISCNVLVGRGTSEVQQ